MLIDNTGYKTYIVFMCFMIVGIFYSIFLLPELRNKSLEEIDEVFQDQSGREDRERRERVAKQIGLDKVQNEVMHKEHQEKNTAV